MAETVIPALAGTYVIWWNPRDDDGGLLPLREALDCGVYKLPVVGWICRPEEDIAPLEPITPEGIGIGDAFRQAVLFPDGMVWDGDPYDHVEIWMRSDYGRQKSADDHKAAQAARAAQVPGEGSREDS